MHNWLQDKIGIDYLVGNSHKDNWDKYRYIRVFIYKDFCLDYKHNLQGMMYMRKLDLEYKLSKEFNKFHSIFRLLNSD